MIWTHKEKKFLNSIPVDRDSHILHVYMELSLLLESPTQRAQAPEYESIQLNL